LVGRVRPARHYGSIDIFLEAINCSSPGDVLVIDNNGRRDEACIVDLITLEARIAALSGVVVWGMHRDTSELRSIRLPVFSLGAFPAGSKRTDSPCPLALLSATCGDYLCSADDFVLGDDDGVLFVPLKSAGEIAELASSIRDKERQMATSMKLGTTFRQQIHFEDYLISRDRNPSITLGQHISAIITKESQIK
jgi:regulator of RNase E activity RraA